MSAHSPRCRPEGSCEDCSDDPETTYVPGGKVYAPPSEEGLRTGIQSCAAQTEKMKVIEEEMEHTRKRLYRQKIAPVLQFTVYAFNCSDHGSENGVHFDYVAGPGRMDIPNALQATIAGLEHALASLKAKLA